MGKKSHSRFSEAARPLPFVVALPTPTPNTSSGFLPVRIAWVKWMSAFTVGFLFVLCAQTLSAKNVLAGGGQFNMSGVHTGTVSTEMVTNQMIGCKFNKHSVNQSVCELGLYPIDSGDAVAVDVFSSRPLPTRRVVEELDNRHLNLGKEAGKNCAINGNTVRIVVGHFSLLNRLNLARVIKGRHTFGSPFSILA